MHYQLTPDFPKKGRAIRVMQCGRNMSKTTSLRVCQPNRRLQVGLWRDTHTALRHGMTNDKPPRRGAALSVWQWTGNANRVCFVVVFFLLVIDARRGEQPWSCCKYSNLMSSESSESVFKERTKNFKLLFCLAQKFSIARKVSQPSVHRLHAHHPLVGSSIVCHETWVSHHRHQ